MSNLLVLTIFLPAIGALVVCALSGRGRIAVRQSALVTVLLTLVFVGVLVWNYEPDALPYAASSTAWLGPSSAIDIQFSVGLDGLSLWLFALSALLLLTCVLVSWESIADRPATFYSFWDVRGCFGRKTPQGRTLESSDDVVEYLVTEAGVITASGKGFMQDGFLRISFATPEEDIVHGVRAAAEALGKLK